MNTFHAWSLALLLTACAATPTPEPNALADLLVADLVAGDNEAAAKRFDPVADDEGYRERIYPIVFNAARGHYEQGGGQSAARLLRFLVTEFPNAPAAREALVYALFLDRAGSSAPAEEEVKELGEHLAALRARDAAAPDFVHLIAAQAAIDRGDLDLARNDLDRFLERWDGRPADLLPYVEDLSRYLGSEGGR